MFKFIMLKQWVFGKTVVENKALQATNSTMILT